MEPLHQETTGDGAVLSRDDWSRIHFIIERLDQSHFIMGDNWRRINFIGGKQLPEPL